jgi:peptidyl-prolyl cis-trans isomerase SurA
MKRMSARAHGTVYRVPVATVLGVLLLCAVPADARIVNRVMATIDGDPITMYELSQYGERAARLQQLPPVDEATLLEALITDRAVQQEIRDQGITVQEEDVDRYIEGIRTRNNLTEEQLHKAVEQQGIAWEDYRQQVREDLQKVQLINREVRGKVNVTPEDVQRYYDAHRDEYSTPAAVTISHIVLRLPNNASQEQIDETMNRAEALYARLKDGADFAELARESSEDAAAADGGRLGEFKQGEMLEEFEKVVGKLKPGQFSEPVRTRVGIHIVRLDERIGSGYQPVEKLADGIKEQLYSKAMEERYDRFLREDVRQRHHVEILP